MEEDIAIATEQSFKGKLFLSLDDLPFMCLRLCGYSWIGFLHRAEDVNFMAQHMLSVDDC